MPSSGETQEVLPAEPPFTARRSRQAWILFLLVLFVILNVVVARAEVDLDSVGGRISTGSYAISAFGMGERPEQSSRENGGQRIPRVILLGNSVLQYTEVDPALRRKRDSAGLRFELGNFAQTGSSIADLLFAYQHVKRFKPDLLVVQVCSLTFGYDWPLFRTDNYKNGALPGYVDLLRLGPISAELDRNDYVEIGTYSYLPVYRYLTPLRGAVKNMLSDQVDSKIGLPLMDFFPTSLNLAQVWNDRTRLDRKISVPREYPGAEKLLKAFLARLEADGQRTLIISQESTFTPLPVMSALPKLTDRERISFLDFSHFHKQALFLDPIHPTPEGSEEVAERLLEGILSSGVLGE